MSFILWLIVGGLLGWVASMIMGTNDTQGKILNIVVGIVGAFLGGLLLAPLLRHGHHQSGRLQLQLPDRLVVGRRDTAVHRRAYSADAPRVATAAPNRSRRSRPARASLHLAHASPRAEAPVPRLARSIRRGYSLGSMTAAHPHKVPNGRHRIGVRRGRSSHRGGGQDAVRHRPAEPRGEPHRGRCRDRDRLAARRCARDPPFSGPAGAARDAERADGLPARRRRLARLSVAVPSGSARRARAPVHASRRWSSPRRYS